MKKTAIIILTLCMTSLQLSGLNLTGNTSYTSDDDYRPVLDLFATAANSGITASTRTGKFLAAGVQINAAVNPEDGVLSEAGNGDNYYFPLAWANIKLGRFILFGRGLLINQDNIKFTYLGGGIGYILVKGKLLLPEIRTVAAWHRLTADDAAFETRSITANLIADYKLPIPVLGARIFANAGYERNNLSTSWDETAFSVSNRDFWDNKFRVTFGASVKLFGIMNVAYEFTYKPSSNHNLSIAVQL